MTNSVFDSSLAYLELRDSMLFVRFKIAVVNLDVAKKMVEEKLAFLNQQELPALLDIKALRSIDKESRDYLARGEGARGITAGALLVDNFFAQAAGSVFINFSKPNVPTKLFLNELLAVKWLGQFKD